MLIHMTTKEGFFIVGFIATVTIEFHRFRRILKKFFLNQGIFIKRIFFIIFILGVVSIIIIRVIYIIIIIKFILWNRNCWILLGLCVGLLILWCYVEYFIRLKWKKVSFMFVYKIYIIFEKEDPELDYFMLL